METTVTLKNIFELEDAQAIQALTGYLKYQVCKKDPQGSPFHYLAQIDGPVRPVAVGFFEELNGNNTDNLKESLRTPKSDLYKAIYGHYINRQLDQQPALYLLLPKHKRGMVALVKPTDSGLRVKGLFIGATEDRDIHIKLNLLRDSSPILRGLFVDTPNIDHLFYEPVKTAEELAAELARITREIEQTIVDLYGDEPEDGFLHQLHQSFKAELLPLLKLQSGDLKEYGFADLYAQTISYGMFTARCFKPQQAFERRSISDYIPPTNPFLRHLFESISKDTEGRARQPEYKPLFDHIEDLVGCLASTNMYAVLEDWGHDKTHDEDIVIHFYETFLKKYNPAHQEIRGVYYTPSPVVSYIVRSVDLILKEKFNKPLGLADPEVLILDPATGTGTFLFHIFKHLESHYKTHMKDKPTYLGWDAYVDKHILPRLFGFELMMAPYAVAHLRLGDELQRSAYTFSTKQRMSIYLTNTLAESLKKSETFFGEFIANESNEAAEIKKNKPITLVIGNPPYSGISANMEAEIAKIVSPYKIVDGKPLGERKHWLQDDYVKFIRFAQSIIEKNEYGIVAYITNHSFIDNPTFRGMRQNIQNTFDEIYILDLHGSAKRKIFNDEVEKDENVFPIQQGVAISFFIKYPPQIKPKDKKLYHSDLWGRKEVYREKELIGGKYHWLVLNDLKSTSWTSVTPTSPYYLFVSRDFSSAEEYSKYWKITDIMKVNSTAVQTSRDNFVIDLEKERLLGRVKELGDVSLSDEELREQYKLKDGRNWKMKDARSYIKSQGIQEDDIKTILYRPFDKRYIYYSDKLITWPRNEVMKNMGENNIALLVTRHLSGDCFKHVLCTDELSEMCVVSTATKEQNYHFPLYIYSEQGKFDLTNVKIQEKCSANISYEFISEIKKKLGLVYVDIESADLENQVGPKDIFNYIYTILHSEAYRFRYLEFLKLDFPKIPLTSDIKLFQKLARIGSKLVQAHLMHKTFVNNSHYPVQGDNLVQNLLFKDSRIYINNKQYFDNVSEDVWNFEIGGYAVCKQWLSGCRGNNTRQGKTLSETEISHFLNVLSCINETLELMTQIDETIEEHGGWPIQ